MVTCVFEITKENKIVIFFYSFPKFGPLRFIHFPLSLLPRVISAVCSFTDTLRGNFANSKDMMTQCEWHVVLGLTGHIRDKQVVDLKITESRSCCFSKKNQSVWSAKQSDFGKGWNFLWNNQAGRKHSEQASVTLVRSQAKLGGGGGDPGAEREVERTTVNKSHHLY